MAKKKKPPDPPIGVPPWMLTYSDMVTLLLTFFIMMLAMANFDDIQKIQAVFKSIRKALGVGGSNSQLIAVLEEKAFTEPQNKTEAVKPTIARIRQAMSAHFNDSFIQMTTQDQEVRLRLDERVFFMPGKAKLHPAAYAFLGDLAGLLKDENVDIRVEGYTDATGAEIQNWKLSSARALAVVLALRETGPFPGERLEAVALGPFHEGNVISENDPWNRRIELVVRGNHVAASAAADVMENQRSTNGR
jgi:chemotaxis protein MotB